MKFLGKAVKLYILDRNLVFSRGFVNMHENDLKYGIKYSPANSMEEINLKSLIDRITILDGVKIIDNEDNLYIILYSAYFDVEFKIKYDGTIVVYFSILDLNNMLLTSSNLIHFLKEKGIISFYMGESVQFIYHGSNSGIKTTINYIFYTARETFEKELNRDHIYSRGRCLIISDIPMCSHISKTIL
jgi:hypothetical protein